MANLNPSDIDVAAAPLPDLPNELISNILSRLPVKPLLRFKCVCKPWYAMISGEEFIKAHMKRAMQEISRLFLVRMDKTYSFRSVSVDDAISFRQAAKLPFPIKPVCSDSEVVGTCNGLICISDTPKSMTIYNPSTRKLRRIPVCSDAPGQWNPNYWVNFGFGYDSTADDYKILRIDQYHNYDVPETPTWVYSFRANSWKKIKDYPYQIPSPRVDGKFVNGALHWNVTTLHERLPVAIDTIAAFDVHAEKFNRIPLPDGWDYTMSMGFFKLGVFHENLMLINHDDFGGFDVWVMKEYGKQESWAKLFNFGHHSMDTMHVMPLLYVEEKSKVLMEDAEKNKYFWYDLKSQKIESSGIQGLKGKFRYLSGYPHAFGAKLYIETLVWCGDGEVSGAVQETSREVVKKGQEMVWRKKGTDNVDDFLSKGFKLNL